METQYTTGGGVSDICPVSQSDQTLIDQNFLKRIEELEKAVSKLLAQNVWSNQLSDISAQVGWATGITYMGIPGWQQTMDGTLIFPPGVTLADVGLANLTNEGNPCSPFDSDFHVKPQTFFNINDSDGNSTFNSGCNGALGGSAVDLWNAGGAMANPDYALYYFSTPGTVQQSRGITFDTVHAVSQDSSDTTFTFDVTVSQAGLYVVNIAASWIPDITSSGVLDAHVSMVIKNTGGGPDVSASRAQSFSTVDTAEQGISLGSMFRLPANGVILISGRIDSEGTASTKGLQDVNMYVLRVGSGV